MAIKLNHTIVNVRDKRESSDFLAELFGSPSLRKFGAHFFTVELANDVTLDFCDADYEVEKPHYAFLDFLEVITVPYGGWRAEGLRP